jgi:antitoxin HicB
VTTKGKVEVADQQIAEYVAKPYARILTPAEEGGYVAEVLEVPGAISEGDTAEEAIEMVNDALGGIIAVMLEDGEKVPDPIGFNEYSGRFNLRVSSDVHREAVMRAQVEGVSLNQWVAQAIVARLAGQNLADEVVEKLSGAQTSRNVRHVVPNSQGGWDVMTPGESRFSSHHRTQSEAEARAKEILRNDVGGEAVIHGRDGKIRDSDTVAPATQLRQSMKSTSYKIGPRSRRSPKGRLLSAKPGKGRYCCTMCNWSVTLDNDSDRLPPCGSCGASQQTYSRC